MTIIIIIIIPLSSSCCSSWWGLWWPVSSDVFSHSWRRSWGVETLLPRADSPFSPKRSNLFLSGRSPQPWIERYGCTSLLLQAWHQITQVSAGWMRSRAQQHLQIGGVSLLATLAGCPCKCGMEIRRGDKTHPYPQQIGFGWNSYYINIQTYYLCDLLIQVKFKYIYILYTAILLRACCVLYNSCQRHNKNDKRKLHNHVKRSKKV